MDSIADSKKFQRILEIIPGALAWSILILPFLLAATFPIFVAYFILGFNLYWFLKALNIMRHMLAGFSKMQNSMKIDWLERCKLVSEKPQELVAKLRDRYRKSNKKFDYNEYVELNNLKEHYDLIKDWREIYQVVFVANAFEPLPILTPTLEALKNSNYPNDHIIVVLAGEGAEGKPFIDRANEAIKLYDGVFNDFIYTVHHKKEGEVVGKGPNLTAAGRQFMEYMKKERPEIKPENVLLTTLDADHLVHAEYFSKLTYKYIIDPNRSHKTYQPVPLLTNNIWDTPAPNRVVSMGSTFWQIVESMRPYRLRTFAAHTQSLETLLATDFWSVKTIVEDGHQYWRTYFAYNGEHYMVPLLIPVYQDCVLAEGYFEAFKNQYKQRRRWAWGISDFPFIVRNFIKHREIPMGEKILQTFRMFSGSISWSTASFLMAFAWVPLLFNTSFQNTVLAHNVVIYSSGMLRLAWVGIFANMWVYFILLPPKPSHKSRFMYLSMLIQWFLAPVASILLSSLPAFESQTRLMLGKYLEIFWITPKVRKSAVSIETENLGNTLDN